MRKSYMASNKKDDLSNEPKDIPPLDGQIHIEEAIKKTSEDWYAELGGKYIILNPDGWDRKNYLWSYYEELITIAEYNERVMNSTILSEAMFGTFEITD